MFREKIKSAIGEQNLRIMTVAKECDINAACLSSYLNGQRGLRLAKIERLIEYLDLSLVPKEDFKFHSDFIENEDKEREARYIAKLSSQ